MRSNELKPAKAIICFACNEPASLGADQNFSVPPEVANKLHSYFSHIQTFLKTPFSKAHIFHAEEDHILHLVQACSNALRASVAKVKNPCSCSSLSLQTEDHLKKNGKETIVERYIRKAFLSTDAIFMFVEPKMCLPLMKFLLQKQFLKGAEVHPELLTAALSRVKETITPFDALVLPLHQSSMQVEHFSLS